MWKICPLEHLKKFNIVVPTDSVLLEDMLDDSWVTQHENQG